MEGVETTPVEGVDDSRREVRKERSDASDSSKVKGHGKANRRWKSLR